MQCSKCRPLPAAQAAHAPPLSVGESATYNGTRLSFGTSRCCRVQSLSLDVRGKPAGIAL